MSSVTPITTQASLVQPPRCDRNGFFSDHHIIAARAGCFGIKKYMPGSRFRPVSATFAAVCDQDADRKSLMRALRNPAGFQHLAIYRIEPPPGGRRAAISSAILLIAACMFCISSAFTVLTSYATHRDQVFYSNGRLHPARGFEALNRMIRNDPGFRQRSADGPPSSPTERFVRFRTALTGAAE